ncbi:MAG: flagellar biosynthesis anti-sigma factor FlgM [Halieaceae bacterium]
MNGEIKPTSDATQALLGARDKGVQTKSEGPAATREPTGAGADSVMLTDKAQQLLQLEEQLAQFPAVDSKRVESIRQAIADGSYQVDAERIADRMLQLEAEQKKSEL